MYGSSFCIVTRTPRFLSRRPSEDAVSPLPSEEATPPVTKMCLVTGSQVIARASSGRWMVLAGRCQQFGCVFAGRRAAGRARQHAGELDHSILVGERDRGGGRGGAVV